MVPLMSKAITLLEEEEEEDKRFFSSYNKGRGNDESDWGKRFNKSQV